MGYYLGGPACLQHRGRDQLTCNELMNRDYPVPPGLKHQVLCVLNELQAARDLATRLDKDPNSIVEPYLQELLKLCSPTIKPVSVAERLPGPDDCDGKGRCWIFDPGDHVSGPVWAFEGSEEFQWLKTQDEDKVQQASQRGRLTWLPHYALPLPTRGTQYDG